MRKVCIGNGASGCRSSEIKVLKTVAFMLLSVLMACAAVGPGSEALARYSTAQAKMAGQYESFSVTPSARKKKYGNTGRSSTSGYKKPKYKKTYKKNRSGKYSYGSKKRKGKSASYRRNSSKKPARYKAKKSNTKVAALGPAYVPQPQKSLTGGGVRWVASSGCLNGTLKSVVYQVAAKFGSVTVSSTCRSKSRNARVGGAKKSQHLHGNAVDFRVHGNYGPVYAYLKSHGAIGGYKHYGGGLFHIDTGPRRTW
ncbi:MAG: DUF882 domain-containing protein [Alphaproteobacteria bacterium]|nr:DUF882 domain-containing protein [Alphaproteobacteria bacterium]